MTYTYPSPIFITFKNKSPNLVVRLFIAHRLQYTPTRAVDTQNNNVYTSNSIKANQVDGSPNSQTEPLIMARMESLDYSFRGSKYYTYGVAFDKLEPGFYDYLIEAREADILTQGTTQPNRELGAIVETKQDSLLVQYSDLDRVVCVGNSFDGEPIYKSITDLLTTLYTHTVSSNSLAIGASDKDLIINLPNVKDGEIIILTYKESIEEFLGNQYEAVVVNNKAKILQAPLGKYLLKIKSSGDTVVIEHF